MTIEQRQQAFIAAYNELVVRYGFTLVSRTVPADTPVAVTPPLVVVAVADWREPEALNSAPNGKERETA